MSSGGILYKSSSTGFIVTFFLCFTAPLLLSCQKPNCLVPSLHINKPRTEKSPYVTHLGSTLTVGWFNWRSKIECTSTFSFSYFFFRAMATSHQTSLHGGFKVLCYGKLVAVVPIPKRGNLWPLCSLKKKKQNIRGCYKRYN